MKAVRSVLPGVLAAAAWLASGGIELLGRRTLSGPVRHVLSLVAPETVPLGDLTAPSPFGPAMTAASAVAVGAAFTIVLGAVRNRGGRRSGPTAFAAYWFCAVVAGSAVAAIPELVALLAAHREHAMPISLAAEHLTGIAHWGLVWGWLPALTALLLDRGPRVRRVVLLPVAAAVFLLAAISLVVVAPQADAARQAQTTADAAAPVAPPAPSVQPLPLVAPGDWQIDPRWCTSGQLEFSAGPVEAAAGSRALVVHATNVSDARCELESYPDIAFSDIREYPLDVSIDHGGRMLSTDPGISRVGLAPGAQAEVTLAWSAMPTAGLEPAGFLYIAAYHGAERQLVQIDSDITEGAVSVTAWAPAPAARG